MRELGGLRWAAVAAVALAVAALRRGVPAAPPAGSHGGPVEKPAETLDGCLRRIADDAPGRAVRQQIERLLATRPGRAELVAACVAHRDRLSVRHPALAGRLEAALRAAGVEELVAGGERFDPERHCSVDVEHVADAALHDRVALTSRPGYRDGDTILRLPDVVVYVHASRQHGHEAAGADQ